MLESRARLGQSGLCGVTPEQSKRMASQLIAEPPRCLSGRNGSFGPDNKCKAKESNLSSKTVVSHASNHAGAADPELN